MTPRERGGSAGAASGYCCVTDLRVICRSVTASPFARPLPGTPTKDNHARSSWHVHGRPPSFSFAGFRGRFSEFCGVWPPLCRTRKPATPIHL